MKSILQILILFIISITYSWSQELGKTYDSLYVRSQTLPSDTSKTATLGLLFQEVLYRNPKLAKEHALEQLELARKLKNAKYKGLGYYNLARVYENTGKRDSSKIYFEKALEQFIASDDIPRQLLVEKSMAIQALAQGRAQQALDKVNRILQQRKQIGDSLGMAKDYNFKSGIFIQLGKSDSAYAAVIRSLSFYNELDDAVGKADALLGLASLENTRGESEKSIEYSLEALTIYKEENDLFYQALTTSGIGNTYLQLEKYEQAASYLEESIFNAEKLGAIDILGAAHTSLGRAYAKLNRPKAAEASFKKAINYVKKSQRPLANIRAVHYLGELYLNEGEAQKALYYLNRSVQLSDSISAPDFLKTSYETRSKAFKALGEYRAALEDYEQFQKLNDSLYSAEKSKQIEALRATFDTERKEQQLLQQQTEIELLEAKERSAAMRNLLLGGGLILALIMMGLGFYAYQLRLKRNRAERARLDAELEFKRKELTTHTLHLAKKNEVLRGLKDKAEDFKNDTSVSNGYQQLISTINFNLQDDQNWDKFSAYFEQVHKGFNKKAKNRYPDLTANELRLMAFIKMNLPTKEIANILHISPNGVKKARYRLRKKMELSTDTSLDEVVFSI